MTNQISINGLFKPGTILCVNGEGNLMALGFITRTAKQNLLHIGGQTPFAITDKEYEKAQERVAAERAATLYEGHETQIGSVQDSNPFFWQFIDGREEYPTDPRVLALRHIANDYFLQGMKLETLEDRKAFSLYAENLTGAGGVDNDYTDHMYMGARCAEAAHGREDGFEKWREARLWIDGRHHVPYANFFNMMRWMVGTAPDQP